MLRFTALLMLVRIKSLLKGAFLHITEGSGSVYSNPKNQLKDLRLEAEVVFYEKSPSNLFQNEFYFLQIYCNVIKIYI